MQSHAMKSRTMRKELCHEEGAVPWEGRSRAMALGQRGSAGWPLCLLLSSPALGSRPRFRSQPAAPHRPRPRWKHTWGGGWGSPRPCRFTARHTRARKQLRGRNRAWAWPAMGHHGTSVYPQGVCASLACPYVKVPPVQAVPERCPNPKPQNPTDEAHGPKPHRAEMELHNVTCHDPGGLW